MASLEGLIEDWPAATFRLGAEAAALTHGHPTGYLSAGCFALIVALLVRGKSLDHAIQVALHELSRHRGHEETFQAMRDAERAARTNPMNRMALSSLGGGWVAEEALAIGLYCALSASNFASGVLLAVNHDGDSDSTGSIAGNLLGLMLGEEEIPAYWLDELELRALIGQTANELFALQDEVAHTVTIDPARQQCTRD
jgi:ADP-ribosylglycohydrolase